MGFHPSGERLLMSTEKVSHISRGLVNLLIIRHASLTKSLDDAVIADLPLDICLFVRFHDWVSAETYNIIRSVDTS